MTSKPGERHIAALASMERRLAGPGNDDDDDAVPIGEPPDDDEGGDWDDEDEDEDDDEEPLQVRSLLHRNIAIVPASRHNGARASAGSRFAGTTIGRHAGLALVL
jgi:hypothetical protein